MKGGIGWNLRISGIGWDIWAFYLMFLFWEIDMKLCKDFTKTYKCKILYKIRIVLNRSYSTNTQPFWKRRYHRGARETHVCSYYYLNLIIFHFSFTVPLKWPSIDSLMPYSSRVSIKALSGQGPVNLSMFLHTKDMHIFTNHERIFGIKHFLSYSARTTSSLSSSSFSIRERWFV